MITEEKKRREAFKFNADLSDKEIRSIRATAQGMTTYQYESFLRDIGIEFEWFLDQKYKLYIVAIIFKLSHKT